MENEESDESKVTHRQPKAEGGETQINGEKRGRMGKRI